MPTWPMKMVRRTFSVTILCYRFHWVFVARIICFLATKCEAINAVRASKQPALEKSIEFWVCVRVCANVWCVYWLNLWGLYGISKLITEVFANVNLLHFSMSLELFGIGVNVCVSVFFVCLFHKNVFVVWANVLS